MTQQQEESREQEQKFQMRLNIEMDRTTMSWDNELREWHRLAMVSLQHASPAGLGIRCEDFEGLLHPENTGVKLKQVMILCNCLERKTAVQMGMTVEAWAKALKLNAKIGECWTAAIAPIHERLVKELKSQIKIPKMQLILPGGEA